MIQETVTRPHIAYRLLAWMLVIVCEVGLVAATLLILSYVVLAPTLSAYDQANVLAAIIVIIMFAILAPLIVPPAVYRLMAYLEALIIIPEEQSYDNTHDPRPDDRPDRPVPPAGAVQQTGTGEDPQPDQGRPDDPGVHSVPDV